MNREGQFEVEVRARDSYRHHVIVRQPGDTVYWTFATKKKNIGFGLLYVVSSGENLDENGAFNGGSNNNHTLTLASSVSAESLSLARKNSQLLAQTPPEAALSTEHIREILRCAHPLVHISPPPRQQTLAGVNRSGSIDENHLSAMARNVSAESLLSGGNVNGDAEDTAGLVPIVPVERYSSAEATVTGSLDAPIAGTYVLLFDNTFSINTSKQLTLCVSVRRSTDGPAIHSLMSTQMPASVVCGGWMLKRKRLRMQGFSKRWFKLDSTGLMTYHDDLEGPVKGGLNVRMCVITKVPPRLLLTLDSGTELFHLKALTESDYRQWCEKIAAVIQSFQEEAAQPSKVEQPREQSHAQLLQGRILEHRITCAKAMEELKEAGEKEQDTAIARYLGRLEKTFASLNAFHNDLITLERLIDRETAGVVPSLPAAAPEEDVFYDVIIEEDASEGESALGELDKSMVEHLTVPSAEPSLAPSIPEESELVQQQLAAGAQLVRLALPARATPINVTYTQMLGRLSSRNATTPVILNEPLSLLQRQCEELEYCELLYAACRATTPVDRIANIAAFAVSCYAGCLFRYEYKPFTPMLGETFEWFDSVRGFRFVAEKVEHRPETILACHAESIDGKWTFWQELQVKTKNWGKTAELTPGGFTHVRVVCEDGSRVGYKWNKVTSCVRNLLSRDVFIDNCGEMLVSCDQDDSIYAKLEFMKSASEGMWGSLSTAIRTGRNEVGGVVVQGRKAVARLAGRWDDYLAVDERMLWKAVPPPANCRDYYGFSLFALQLNVPVAPEAALKPAPTDSRFRPDQRLVEEGDIESADREKARLEQKQRAERAVREERDEDYEPFWFVRSDNGEYRFLGEYFQAREHSFTGTQFPNLF